MVTSLELLIHTLGRWIEPQTLEEMAIGLLEKTNQGNGEKEGNDGARQQGWTGGICLVVGSGPYPFFALRVGPTSTSSTKVAVLLRLLLLHPQRGLSHSPPSSSPFSVSFTLASSYSTDSSSDRSCAQLVLISFTFSFPWRPARDCDPPFISLVIRPLARVLHSPSIFLH